MYIEAVPNRNSPPAILLRESYRHQGKVKKRTLANLSKWDPDLVAGLRILLKKGTAVANFETSLDIVRSQPTATSPPCSAPCARSVWIAASARPVPSAIWSSPWSWPVSPIPAPSSPPPAACGPPPAPIPSPTSSASRTSTKITSTTPWTGCSSARTPFRSAWPGDT